jgi:type IV pilus assembly protein PilV
MTPRNPGFSAGFSLIEVLVTLVVVAVGLLGLAKMQAASISNTQVSRVRSLIALQAGSLASAMHGNRDFWAKKGAAAVTFTASGDVVTDPANVLSGTRSCVSNVCTPAELAADDVQTWVRNLNRQFPGYQAAVSCTATDPVNCNITLNWTEKYVAINRSTVVGAATQTAPQGFTLYVQP